MSPRGRRRAEQTLTQACAALLSRALLPDLEERAKQPEVAAALRSRHAAERAQRRTGEGFREWCSHLLEQVGAAWILSCIYVRTLEDRDALGHRRLAGPGAGDAEQLFFELAPNLGPREYLLTVFREVSRLPGTDRLLGPAGNLAWRLAPSQDACRALLDFVRATDDAGNLRWTFAGHETRFLGDLYQDLSVGVRKRYALLQTPEFVEEFILDLTLEPAVQERGVEAVRLIDPACGSGHFLLGAFRRLVRHRQAAQPGVDVPAHALAALDQVAGIGVNPYAVAIARFRLVLAWMEVTGTTRLREAPKLEPNVAVGDSLLKGTRSLADTATDRTGWGGELFVLEEPAAPDRILHERCTVVVGNPPYITCKDPELRERYRAAYRDSAAGKYAFAAPFTERFFELSERDGWAGMVTANSFMKREFGKGLIQKVLPRLDVTHVIDTSGAYIPGHGTRCFYSDETAHLWGGEVLGVLGKRGEPETPEDAARGKVWSSIAMHFRDVGYEDEFISVVRLARESLGKHPWSLAGGGTGGLKELLEQRCETKLGELASSIGISSFTLEDEVYVADRAVFRRCGVAEEHVRPMVVGECIRDWRIEGLPWALFPYDSNLQPQCDEDAALMRFMWPYRTNLANNKLFGGKTKVEGGLLWFEYGRLTADKLRTPLSIAFAFVATHNHFVLDRGGKVFKQSAPIIKLRPDATEDDHYALLGYLNSSTARFWMKQVFQPKHSAEHKTHPEPERNRYEHAGTGLEKLPVPAELLHDGEFISVARRLTTLASARAKLMTLPWIAEAVETSATGQELEAGLRDGWSRHDALARGDDPAARVS